MINVLAYSAGRSDQDRWIPFLNSLKKDRSINLFLILASTHFDKKFGNSYKTFKKNSFKFKFRKFKSNNTLIENLFEEAKEFENIIKSKINYVILLGDRFEILNIAYLATIHNIPIIHIYGGAITTGAIDNQIRNSVSKLSHFHLVACSLYKERLIRMGEDSKRVKVIGINSLHEYILHRKSFSRKDIEKKINFSLKDRVAFVTIHPVTLYPDETKKILKSVFKVIVKLNLRVIFTYPNNDIGSNLIINEISQFCSKNYKDRIFIPMLKLDLFSSILNNINIVIGNSSCGIVECASFSLPVVNIGSRQNGKLIPKNVIISKTDYKNVLYSTNLGLSDKFKKTIKFMSNPYFKDKFDISKLIKTLNTNKSLLIKK